jgi:hypothetical protein
MRLLLLLPVALLSGCNQIGPFAGAAAALVTGAGTANPGVAVAVGLAVNAGVSQLEKVYARRRERNEQDHIAGAAGPLAVGDTAAWRVQHTIPIGNEHGTVTVLADVPNPLGQCREVLFTVQDGKEASDFVSHVCLDNGQWTLADAEPAVERWSFMQ